MEPLVLDLVSLLPGFFSLLERSAYQLKVKNIKYGDVTGAVTEWKDNDIDALLVPLSPCFRAINAVGIKTIEEQPFGFLVQVTVSNNHLTKIAIATFKAVVNACGLGSCALVPNKPSVYDSFSTQ